jgi:hypothetical protein
MLALLLSSASAAADCVRPEPKDPATFQGVSRELRDAYAFSYISRIHDFLVCQRRSLEARSRGLAAPDVRQLVLNDRVVEERVLAEANQIFSCMSKAGREPDPAIVRKQCETYIEWELKRRADDPPREALKNDEHHEHGGIWSYRVLDLGRPGQCDDGECDKLLGVEVTNTTPVVLRCEVALSISNRKEGARRGERVIKLYPGDVLPAAQVRSYWAPESVGPQVTCAAARPLAPDFNVPASCVLNWLPRPVDFPRGFGREWISGSALVEFAVGPGHRSVEAIRLVQADSAEVGRAAQDSIGKFSASTNCAGQRFRMRVEYRPFTCFGCMFESGTVSVTRDDRLLPDVAF